MPCGVFRRVLVRVVVCQVVRLLRSGVIRLFVFRGRIVCRMFCRLCGLGVSFWFVLSFGLRI